MKSKFYFYYPQVPVKLNEQVSGSNSRNLSTIEVGEEIIANSTQLDSNIPKFSISNEMNTEFSNNLSNLEAVNNMNEISNQFETKMPELNYKNEYNISNTPINQSSFDSTFEENSIVDFLKKHKCECITNIDEFLFSKLNFELNNYEELNISDKSETILNFHINENHSQNQNLNIHQSNEIKLIENSEIENKNENLNSNENNIKALQINENKVEEIILIVFFPPIKDMNNEIFLNFKLELLHKYEKLKKEYKLLHKLTIHFLSKYWFINCFENNKINTTKRNLNYYLWTEVDTFDSFDNYSENDDSSSNNSEYKDSNNITHNSRTKYNLRSRKKSIYNQNGILSDDEFDEYPIADVDNQTLLCKWRNIDLTQGDYNRLEPFQYLNDNIIDMARERMEIPDNCFIFNTFFYNLLERNIDRVSTTIPNRGVKLFDKEFLFIPINRRNHWSLLVVCLKNILLYKRPIKQNSKKRKSITNSNNEQEHEENQENQENSSLDNITPECYKKELEYESKINNLEDQNLMEMNSLTTQQNENPNIYNQEYVRAIIACDSLRHRHSNTLQGAIAKIRQYLSLRWDFEKNNKPSTTTFSPQEFRGTYATLPIQDNNCDCGVYVIRYIEEIMKNPPTQIPFENTNLFSSDSISEYRKLLQNFMNTIIKEYQENNSNKINKPIEDSDDDLEVVCVIPPPAAKKRGRQKKKDVKTEQDKKNESENGINNYDENTNPIEITLQKVDDIQILNSESNMIHNENACLNNDVLIHLYDDNSIHYTTTNQATNQATNQVVYTIEDQKETISMSKRKFSLIEEQEAFERKRIRNS